LITAIAPKLALYYDAHQHLINNSDSYLYSSGWMASLANKTPQNNVGETMPWMNFSIIELLHEKLTKEQDLFEFGSGYSTHYYAKRVKSVTSIEYDERWYNQIRNDIPSNVELIFQAYDQGNRYCMTITEQDKSYDVVIIDGRDRVNCFKQALAKLSSSGVILLDDSQRSRYSEVFELATKNDFRVLNIAGLKPTGTARDQTSIFYRTDNCFNI